MKSMLTLQEKKSIKHLKFLECYIDMLHIHGNVYSIRKMSNLSPFLNTKRDFNTWQRVMD